MENKSTFARFIDNFFYCFTLIILSIIWCGYLTNKLLTQTIIGILLGSFLYFLIFKIFNRTSKKTLAKSEEQYRNACIQTLSIASPDKTYKFFEIMLGQKYHTKIRKPFILATDKSNEENIFLIHFNFYSSEFSHQELFTLTEHEQSKNSKLLIFSKSFSPECRLIANNSKNLCLLDMHNSYLFFKQFNTFPKISKKIKEKKFSNLKNNIFSSINSKKFIKISLLLVFLSLFTTLKRYYLISASIVFIFAIICHFKKSITKNPESNFNDFISQNGTTPSL